MAKEIKYLFKRVAEFSDLKKNLSYQDKAEKRGTHIRFIAKTFEISKEYRKIMKDKCKDKLILIK